MTHTPVARNELCPCGSGLKYKKCCISRQQAAKPALQEYIAYVSQAADKGMLTEALQVCKELLHHYPQSPMGFFITARVMYLSGITDTSFQLIQKAIALEPTNHIYYALLANLFMKINRYEDAYKTILTALRYKSDEPKYLYFKAELELQHIENKDRQAAITSLCQLMEQYPDFYKIYHLLYKALYEEGRNAEAASVCKKLEDRNPPLETLVTLFTHPPKIFRSQEELRKHRQNFEAMIDMLHAKAKPITVNPSTVCNSIFSLSFHDQNKRFLREKLAALYVKMFPGLVSTAPHVKGWKGPKGKVKIGFVSADFHPKHPLMLCFEPLLTAFAKDGRYHSVLFDMGDKGEELTCIKQGNATHIQLPLLRSAAYKLIVEQECDMLIYLDAGMHVDVYLLAFSRLAPIQCCLTGDPITSGLSTMDYYISSRLWEPEDAKEHYTEELVMLEHPLICLKEPNLPEGSYERQDIAFPKTGHLYYCPATLFKIHPDLYAPMIAILKKDPQGHLLLPQYRGTTYEALQTHLKEMAPEVADRIHFIPWFSPEKFMAAVALSDVILDTFHYGLASTLYQIFKVGTPTVTFEGEFLHGRVAAGLYRYIGVTELIAKTPTEYADIAVRLGTDPTFNQEMRKKILANAPKIYGDTGVAAELKEMCLSLIEKHRLST